MSSTDFTPETEIEKELWNLIKDKDQFTLVGMKTQTELGDWVVENFFRKLRRLKVIRLARWDGKMRLFTALSEEDYQTKLATMRFSHEGAIWSCIRSLGTFSPEDIQAALIGAQDVGFKKIASYCGVLKRAGYLKVMSGTGKQTRYRLVDDTGPLPPRRKRVFVLVDQNVGRVRHVTGERV